MCEICEIKCRLSTSRVKKSGRIDLIADDGFIYHFYSDEEITKTAEKDHPLSTLCKDYIVMAGLQCLEN